MKQWNFKSHGFSSFCDPNFLWLFAAPSYVNAKTKTASYADETGLVTYTGLDGGKGEGQKGGGENKYASVITFQG